MPCLVLLVQLELNGMGLSAAKCEDTVCLMKVRCLVGIAATPICIYLNLYFV